MERPAAVRFGNQDESPTGFEYSQDLSHVGWQVGPVVVRLYSRDNVERAIWERQSGHRTPLDLVARPRSPSHWCLARPRRLQPNSPAASAPPQWLAIL